MPITVSYSGLGLYKQCPSAFQRKCVLKEPAMEPTPESAPALFRGKAMHAEIEDLLEGRRDSLHGDMKFYEQFLSGLRSAGATAENKFAFDHNWDRVDFDSEAAMIRGIDDAAILDQETKTLHVYDWKTGKKYPEHAEQRALYGLAGLLTYPQAERTIVSHVYLDQRKTESTEFHADGTEGMKWMWERRCNKVQPPQPYPETPSWKCKFCNYSQRNGGKCQN